MAEAAAMANEEIAALGGRAAAKVMAARDLRWGASRLSYEEIVGMAGLIDMLGLARPDKLSRRKAPPKTDEKGGL